MNEFATILGAIASAIALAAGLTQTRKFLRQRRRKHRLTQHLVRLRRLDRRLVALVSEAEARLTEGVGWHGFAIWPPALKGHLIYLVGFQEELERTTAALRAMDTEGSVERIRQDLERLSVVIHDVAELYEMGIIAQYQQEEGRPIPVSAAAREHTPTLEDDQVQQAERLRREAQLLFRTLSYQLYGESAGESYSTDWPTLRRALGKVSDPDLWGSEVRPMEYTE